MRKETKDTRHSAMCLRLMRVFPRVIREMRRHQGGMTPAMLTELGPRHVAVLEQLREGSLVVGDLAGRLGLTLSTVSGLLADLDHAGLIDRAPDTADRRRTIVAISRRNKEVVEQWLDGAAAPLARVLDQLSKDERKAFLKAMDLLDRELGPHDAAPE
jgi:DNA-binding MarR family transcriptional regulator